MRDNYVELFEINEVPKKIRCCVTILSSGLVLRLHSGEEEAWDIMVVPVAEAAKIGC